MLWLDSYVGHRPTGDSEYVYEVHADWGEAVSANYVFNREATPDSKRAIINGPADSHVSRLIYHIFLGLLMLACLSGGLKLQYILIEV